MDHCYSRRIRIWPKWTLYIECDAYNFRALTIVYDAETFSNSILEDQLEATSIDALCLGCCSAADESHGCTFAVAADYLLCVDGRLLYVCLPIH